MAKDPAFLFYPNDWIGGTMGMTFEEKGAYMELLMMQFNRGHMEGHMVGQVVGQIWDKIKFKFTQDENGLWFNPRLEDEVNKRKAFTASRKNNLKGKNQYTKKEGQVSGHMTSHMENENRNENKDINIIDKWFKEFPNSSQLELICLNLNTTKEILTNRINEFRKVAKVDYPNFNEFCNHFKNWVKKNPQQPIFKTRELK